MRPANKRHVNMPRPRNNALNNEGIHFCKHDGSDHGDVDGLAGNTEGYRQPGSRRSVQAVYRGTLVLHDGGNTYGVKEEGVMYGAKFVKKQDEVNNDLTYKFLDCKKGKKGSEKRYGVLELDHSPDECVLGSTEDGSKNAPALIVGTCGYYGDHEFAATREGKDVKLTYVLQDGTEHDGWESKNASSKLVKSIRIVKGNEKWMGLADVEEL